MNIETNRALQELSQSSGGMVHSEPYNQQVVIAGREIPDVFVYGGAGLFILIILLSLLGGGGSDDRGFIIKDI